MGGLDWFPKFTNEISHIYIYIYIYMVGGGGFKDNPYENELKSYKKQKEIIKMNVKLKILKWLSFLDVICLAPIFLYFVIFDLKIM